MKLTFKNIVVTIYCIGTSLFIIFLCASFFKGCDSKTTPPHSNKDSLNTIIAEKEQIAEYAINESRVYMAKFDSLLKVKPKYVKGRDRVHDSLVFVSDSICVNSLNILYTECQKVDSVNNSIIDTQSKVIQNDSTIITNFKDINNAQKLIHLQDSTRNKQLTDTLSTVKRKGYVKGFMHGFGVGAATMKTVDVISDLKK